MDQPTTLYRAFDSHGKLLYVGIASRWPSRWAQHAQRSAFFGEVTRIEFETHPSRTAALDAERLAILNEHPLHNVVHNTTSRGKPSARTSESDSQPDRISDALDAGLDPGSLIGSFFHSGARPGWQGCVVAEPAPGVYLVELFSWIMGESSNQQLVSLQLMLEEGWQFYDTGEWMNDAYDQSVARRWEREREGGDS